MATHFQKPDRGYSKVRRFEIVAVFEDCRWRRTLQQLFHEFWEL